MSTNLAKTEPTGEIVQPPTPSALLAMAVQQGADLDKLEKLMQLQERWEANEARKAWVAAMNAFKANAPELLKNKTVSFGDTSYKHATLDHVVKVITESLSKHGLSHRWAVEQLDGGSIRVTCVITHVLGHSESTSLQAGADQSGKKNNIQALGSTVTYLERYTLLAATGLAAKGMDNDGVTVERINEKQAADLQALMDEVKANKPAFLRFFKINAVEDLSVSAYPDAIAMLEAKRK